MRSYSRENAVRYAVAHALEPNPAYRYFAVHGDGGGDCSNFVSQCLLYGGAPMDYRSQRPWWYNSKGTKNSNGDTWSVSWTVAHSLYWCLKIRGEMGLPGLKGIEVSDISILERGDVIQYENKNKVVYHSAIITALGYEWGMKVPFISQHSFDGLNISHIKPTAARMHFMKIVI